MTMIGKFLKLSGQPACRTGRLAGLTLTFGIFIISLPLFPCFAKQTFPFAGALNFQQKNLTLEVESSDEGKFTIRIQPHGPQNYHFFINLNRMKAGGFEVTTQLEGTVLLERLNERLVAIGGEIKSQGSLINQQPVRELDGTFQIKDNTLNFNSVTLGNVTAKGFIDLVRPYKMDMSLNLASLDLEDFISVWLTNPTDYKTSGLVSGKIKVTGELGDPHLSGQLESYQGIVGDLVYDSLKVNFDGRYPLISLYNSSASKTNGFSFTIEGGLDLSDKKTLVRQIDALAKNPIVVEDDTNREWTLKRFENKNAATTTELKYLLKKNEDVSHPLKEDGLDMLGIEQRMEF